MPDPKAAAKPPVAFTQFLQQQRRGLLHAELSDALAEIAAGVIKHGKTGTLTLKLTLKPKADDAIEIADVYTVKVPTPPASASIFFADETGQISRQRINQGELPFTAVEGGGADTEDPEVASS